MIGMYDYLHIYSLTLILFYYRLRLFPRWKDLYHFDGAIKVTFNDGKKHEDLSRVCLPTKMLYDILSLFLQQLLYVIHDIWERNEKSEGYLFARLFRKYLELDIYMSFDLHTEDSILSAENTLKAFGELLLVSVLLFLSLFDLKHLL